uniref:protein-tyrosine-phosphatase n=1 Tax=Meloidogyne hapla TaxID=6305 RepID=A0A1I8B613_MELHA
MIPLENFASQKSVLTAVIESLLKMDISENEWRKALKTAAIQPPRNVRIQTISETSVVVQWDFDDSVDSSEAGQPDGFLVKYVPEPMVARESAGMDKWRSQPVMDPKARHLEIGRLVTQKSYSFCVLAMKQRRLGPCSDPPVALNGPLRPTHVVQNLRLDYKTSQSVQIRWDFDPLASTSQKIGFYLKQMGQKSYLDQDLVEKSMVSPQFEKRVNGSERQLFLANLRPYMNYTLQLGVYSLEDGRHYWPRELQVQTDPRGPPFVEAPEFIQSDGPHTAQFRLSPASEEYGIISHYWMIVIPANNNRSKEAVASADKAQLHIATRDFRNSEQQQHRQRRHELSYLHIQKHPHRKRRHQHINDKTEQKPLDGVYIAAQISSSEMQRLYRDELTFTLGDGLEYEGFTNFPLDPQVKIYQLMSRAFARDDSWKRAFDQPVDHRPPIQEPQSKLYTDSALSDPFETRVPSLFTGGGSIRGGGIMFPLLAAGITFFVIAVLVGMLLLWWLRCKRNTNATRSSTNSIHKTPIRDLPSKANGHGTNGVLPTETNKLLLGMDQDGRPVLNSYEHSAIAGNVEIGCDDLSSDGAVLYSGESHRQPPALISSTEYSITIHSLIYKGISPNTIRDSSNIYGGLTTIGNAHLSLSQQRSANTNTIIPIPLTEFATHIERQKINNNRGFIQEFESIDTGQQFTWENSTMEVNRHKNRYANVVAYDHSRVILPPEDDEDGCEEQLPGNDYINANYIDGYDRPKVYIATQGPLPETFADFWRMVWEERSYTIVVLTRLEERSRSKCDQYWPSRGSSVYGNYKVTLMETTELAHYCLRTLRLENTRHRNEPGRDIQHCQFTAWPDHGVPIHPTPFLMFLKRVKALNPVQAGPIITHCSAGIGRTGAFIVIDFQLDRLRYENSLDVYGCVRAIRSQRQYMVQTDDQYIFIHDALLDAAQSGSTEIPNSKLLQHVQTLSRPQLHSEYTGIDIEFNTLMSLRVPKCFRVTVANATYNINKNVKLTVVPWDFNRVELPRVRSVIDNNENGDDERDYINASWIDGYRSRRSYIATQLPMANTVADFWRMLWIHECSIVAMLVRQPNEPGERFFEYWPTPGYPENYNGLNVDFVSEFDMGHYWLREFKVTDESRHSRTIRQFQFIDWAVDCQGRTIGDVPQNSERFVDFVRQLHQTKQQFGSVGPICVHCLDGAGRTGTFITVSLTICRAKLEHVVDLFTTVKLLRMQRPNMVETREQYEFCYRAAIDFLSSWEEGC